MSDTVRKPRKNPYRKARFSAEAREIIAHDRHNRKWGAKVDTGGTIARALERAYVQGFIDAQKPQDTSPDQPSLDVNELVPWELIPSRPRAAFWSICTYAYSKHHKHLGEEYLEPCPPNLGKNRWQLTIDFDSKNPQTFGHNTLMPLVRMGLLSIEVDEDVLRLTAIARRTWDRFQARGGQFAGDVLEQD